MEAVAGAGWWSDLKAVIVKGRVAEAVTERVEDVAFIVAIGSAGHCVVTEVGEVFDGGIECYGQAAGGVVVAEEYVRDGGSASLTRIPGFDDGGEMLVFPVDGDGAAIEHNQDDWFAGSDDGADQVLLDFGQVEAGAVAAFEAVDVDIHFFSLQSGGEAHTENDRIRLAGGGQGFGAQ